MKLVNLQIKEKFGEFFFFFANCQPSLTFRTPSKVMWKCKCTEFLMDSLLLHLTLSLAFQNPTL